MIQHFEISSDEYGNEYIYWFEDLFHEILLHKDGEPDVTISGVSVREFRSALQVIQNDIADGGEKQEAADDLERLLEIWYNTADAA
ncbi:MAG: hypothetical protein ABIY70_08995 [Capsulimonas sp.]|uniref:hypothetical protein n=1 Tax=Capsulimonas sp. TaxID=2494211 RepID=UPI0032674A14